MKQIDILEEIIVDNFAGGGGASTGIELACGRPVSMVRANLPEWCSMKITTMGQFHDAVAI